MSTAEHTQISLRPLYYLLGALLAIAWINLGWRSIRVRRQLRQRPPALLLNETSRTSAPHDQSV